MIWIIPNRKQSIAKERPGCLFPGLINDQLHYGAKHVAVELFYAEREWIGLVA